MLEQLLIFTRGGLILWAFKELGNSLRGSPIDALIRFCLLEERSGVASYTYDVPGASYTLKWTFLNDLGLVFVAVYQRILHILYVDDLLAMVKQQFSEIYEVKRTSYNGFDSKFHQLKKEAEARAEKIKKPQQVGRNVNNNNIGRNQGQLQNGSTGGGSEKKNSGDGENRIMTNNHVVKENGAFDVNKLRKLRSKAGKETKNVVNKDKIAKRNRVWDDSPKETKLDFTDQVSENREQNRAVVAVDQGESMMDIGKNSNVDSRKKGWISTMFQSIAGKKKLEKSDLEPVLKALKERLMTKNVAEEIAETICESVAANLEGKGKGKSRASLSSIVQAAMEEALGNILTTGRSVDILREVHNAKEQKKPYVVVFIGVNGVGKSTSLAKVAYWLKKHDINVMMAACDTYRSGAVEQLRVRSQILQVPLFEKGYEKDPAIVAKQAIEEASRNDSDVVLVDTAGRMQNNEPLMRALSKLIYVNNPDLILFVGEALVGNTAVDQLSKFNQKLGELSPSTSPNPRLIDGIILTKFDTIDDKVGAALSMVYVSGAPVMFVGCGEFHKDLMKFDVESIVETLLEEPDEDEDEDEDEDADGV